MKSSFAIPHFLLRLVFAIGVALTLMLAVPFALIAAGFWATDGAWNFEGRGFKYWMFVQGSRLERLGAIEPFGAVKYSISLQEGTFPGWSIASYGSEALPEKVVAAYGERCKKMNLKIAENKIEQKQNATRAEMTCKIEVYLDVEIVAERELSASTTKVVVKVWGSE